MQAGGFGILGAVGIHSDGRMVGRVRDRVVLVGDPVTQPADVDSVDELLFMVPRSLVLREPLTQARDMAWHAYAVEYGLRVRKLGLRVGVADIPLTHNSRTGNLHRLDVAHAAIAERYSDLLPVRTTCGSVTQKTARADKRPWLASHRWRYSWLRESLALRGVRKLMRGPAVLADIRRDVDEVVRHSPGHRLHIVNRSRGVPFTYADGEPLELIRTGGRVVLSACDVQEIPTALVRCPAGSWQLLTNLSRDDLQTLKARLPATARLVGFHKDVGYWMLLGAQLADLPQRWRTGRATPLGMRRLMPSPDSL
jgi:hypothetical protein